jgi:Holliday junction resolvase RusA-like endonuclease
VSVAPITIRLAGEPRGKGRPRISTRNGFARAYTPEKTRNYEAALRMAGQDAMAGRPPLDGAISVVIVAALSIPDSMSKGKRLMALSGSLHPTKKPDADNIFKCLDALNGVVWTDDKNIVRADFMKVYAAEPCLTIQVRAA